MTPLPVQGTGSVVTEMSGFADERWGVGRGRRGRPNRGVR